MSSVLSDLLTAKPPPVGFYFLATFLLGGLLPNPLDIRFQKISGLTTTIEKQEIKEGGENLFSYHLPTRVTYDNLVLERGMVSTSLLNLEFNQAMGFLRFSSSNVLVILLNQHDLPISSWLLENAYPIKWSVSDLNARENGVMVDTLELQYARLQRVGIPGR
ncbi:MAG: phage tail protein [Cyanobacteria bacterium P01_G01_bin.54]